MTAGEMSGSTWSPKAIVSRQRDGFRHLRRRSSKPATEAKGRVDPGWRSRVDPLKFGIGFAKRTVQKYTRSARDLRRNQ